MSPAYDPTEDHSDPGHRLEKSVWTESDFETMGWHDCRIRALALTQDDEDDFAGRLLLDLDYIVRWVGDTPGVPFTFWIAPATLVFHGVYDLDGRISEGQALPRGFDCDGITRAPVDDRLGYDRWELDSNLGLGFRAAGFRQIFRREPLHVDRGHLTLEERGGLSFAEEAYDGASTQLAVTHAEHPPAEHRLDEATASQPERTTPPSPDELRQLEWELAHMRLWALVYDLRRAELGGEPPAKAGAREDSHLASVEYRALGSDPRQLAIDRDQMLLMLRDDARGRALSRIDAEYEHVAEEIRRLTAELGR